MKKFITTILVLTTALALHAQCSEVMPKDTTSDGVVIRLQPDSTATAFNTSTGAWSVCAVYPDRAEFVLAYEGRLMVMQPLGDSATMQILPATVTEVHDGVWRAESPQVWVEVNTNTGITVVFQNNFTRVFAPE